MRDCTKLEAWKLADDLVVDIYRRTRTFPGDEVHGLTGQIRQASSLVATNIAAGASTGARRDYVHFLHIATGFLEKTQYFIHLASAILIMAHASLGARASRPRLS